MAWLQNLAGKAEDLLNIVDQNAAKVFNEPQTISTEVNLNHQGEYNGSSPPPDNSVPVVKIDLEHIPHQVETLVTTQNEKSFNHNENLPAPTIPSAVEYSTTSQSLTASNSLEKIKSMTDSFGLASVASSNSLNIDMNINEEAMKLESQVAKLETENEELSKQILSLQHVHAELQHDFTNLQIRLEHADSCVAQAQNEMHEYRIKARKLLEEKQSKLPSQHEDNAEFNQIMQINQELRSDLDKEVMKNTTIEMRLSTVSKELFALQQQYLNAQKENQRVQDGLRVTINNEKKARDEIEEENRTISKELHKVGKELKDVKAIQHQQISVIEDLQQKVRSRPMRPAPVEGESQLQILTQTLMHKQNTLDTVTSERNALRIQLEKLEHQYSQLCTQRITRPPTSASMSNDYDDSRIPRLLQVSPLDAGVTQRMKSAYSTLDAFSIRTGVFLRRYPLARIFLICYMMLLHLWVLVILFTYVPGPR